MDDWSLTSQKFVDIPPGGPGPPSIRACFARFLPGTVRNKPRTIFVTWIDALKHAGGCVLGIMATENLGLLFPGRACFAAPPRFAVRFAFFGCDGR